MSARDKNDLKLIALEPEGLEVMSAHLQDAVMAVGDMTYLPRERRFAAVVNRFDWADALTTGRPRSKTYTRRKSGLRFEHVLSAQLSGIDLADKTRILSLLAIRFEPGQSPAGHVVLSYAGGAAIRIGVDCVEAELKDLGAAWATRRLPKHPDDDAEPTAS